MYVSCNHLQYKDTNVCDNMREFYWQGGKNIQTTYFYQ